MMANEEKNKDVKDIEEMSSQELKTAISKIDKDAMAKKIGVPVESLEDPSSLTMLEREQHPFWKSDLSKEKTVTRTDGRRIDDIKEGDTVTISDGTLSMNEDGTIHCKSEYLGEFDYDPEMFAYGYKELRESDGTTSQLPVLQYVGDHDGSHNLLGSVGPNIAVSNIEIPEGLKSLDYTFEGNKDLLYLPRIPDSVTSMHYGFAHCPELERPSRASQEGEWFSNQFGALYIPNGMLDMSNCYEGSPKLEADFGTLPSSVVNITEAWEGCEGIGSKWKYFGFIEQEHDVPKYGGLATPLLAEEFAKNALNDISNENTKEQADNAEFYVQKDGTLNEDIAKDLESLDKKLTEESGEETHFVEQDLLHATQGAAATDYVVNVMQGDVSNEVEIATDGSRTENKIYNGETDSFEYDETGELKSDKQGGSLWQRLVIDGGVGLGIGAIAGGLTKSKVVGVVAGVGGAILLDKMDVLPKTLSPILYETASWLPEGKLKDTLTGWADELKVSTLDDQKANWTPENVAKDHQSARLVDGLSKVNVADVTDVSKSMYNNGYAAAGKYNALWATATKGEGSAACVRESVVDPCMKAMEQQWQSQIGEDGQPSAELKTEMKAYYEKMFGALDSYNKGAKEGIQQYWGGDEVKTQMSTYGLHMVNRAYVSSVMDSIVQMNEKYQLYTPEELQTLQSKYPIEGIGDLATYKDKSSFDAIRDEESFELDSLLAVDGLELEEPVPEKPSNVTQEPAKSPEKQSSQKEQEKQSSVEKAEPETKQTDRAAALDAQYGDSLEKKEPDVSQQLE